MIRYSNGCILISLAILATAAGSAPNADQLLDRFAANADSHSGSFMIRLDCQREVIIHRIEHPYFKPGERQERYEIDCRWDGNCMRLRKCSRLGPGTTKIDLGEMVRYESTLCDSLKRVVYRKQEGLPKEDNVTYSDKGLSREACFHEIVTNVANWVWGYYPDEDLPRIDGFLRLASTTRVRPETEQVNGSHCYVLEAETRHARYTIWFDPTHGYNFAKLIYETPTTKIVVLNRSFKKHGEAWMAMEMEWEVQLRQPESDMSYSQKTTVTAFEANPDHDKLYSFALDDIPDGTRAHFISGRGYRMPGRFEWHNGKPMPCVDEDAVAQLNRAAESIAGHTTQMSTVSTEEHSLNGVSVKGASSPPYCGLHCLYLIMKVYGQDPNLAELVIPEYLDTPDGSTFSGLKKAVEDAGLYAEVVLRANTRVLRSCSTPVVLHVKGSDASQGYDHYVLFLGAEGEWARICDPPGPVRLVSLAELSSRWGGNGLVVANTRIELGGAVRRAKTRIFLSMACVILAMLLIGRVRRHVLWPEVLSSVIGRSTISIVQFGGLTVASLIIGLAFHSVNIGGFLKYPAGVASTQRAHVADFIPRISLSTARRLKRKGSVFVDARIGPDFDVRHVDGAISVPVDVNDVIRRNAMSAVRLDNPVVVYCKSEMCQFADIVAGKLRLDGFSNVSILRGGWIEWDTGKRHHARRSNKDSESGKWRLNSDGTASPI